MDSLIEELDLKTMDCVQRMDQVSYEQIEEIITLRDHLIHQLDSLILDQVEKQKYRDRIFALLEWDPILFERIVVLREQAEVQLNKLQKAHQQKKAYEAEFQIPDGVFFDKKK